jgi:hypothetical protein
MLTKKGIIFLTLMILSFSTISVLGLSGKGTPFENLLELITNNSNEIDQLKSQIAELQAKVEDLSIQNGNNVPDYDSGWMTIGTNNYLVINHKLETKNIYTEILFRTAGTIIDGKYYDEKQVGRKWAYNDVYGQWYMAWTTIDRNNVYIAHIPKFVNSNGENDGEIRVLIWELTKPQ